LKNHKEEKIMDKKGKFEKMAEMMKRCVTGEGDMTDCCSMMRKMTESCEGEEAKKQEKNTGETGK
jgi:hypothetical protein